MSHQLDTRYYRWDIRKLGTVCMYVCVDVMGVSEGGGVSYMNG